MQKKYPVVSEMVTRLETAAGESLLSVVVYGPAAHGDQLANQKNTNLLVVLSDISLASISKVGGPVRWWLAKGEPLPRVFSPKFITDAADVFPMEFLDITAHHDVVYGTDPLLGLDVKKGHLRNQCERELRETLMRIQEAYLEANGKQKELLALLTGSYPVFASVFRGCLQLGDHAVPARDADVIREFCRHTSLDQGPFAEIGDLRNGVKIASRPAVLFQNYYQQITLAIEALDSFQTENGETT
tara:strand:+ start:17035 stop:17766 length:732 start_codon:yes stop_codon:yes gene_type:complete